MITAKRAKPWLVKFNAVRHLGPRWVIERLAHEIDGRSGYLRHRTPIAAWTDQPAALEPLGLVNIDTLRAWLVEHCDAATIERLRTIHEHLLRREFDVFGEFVAVRDWHHDPIGRVSYDPTCHWSMVKEQPGADLKCVWEPARFGWAFDLVRLELLDPSAGAGVTFWQLFRDFCAANPPNAGVHWSCGQEASIRLVAVALAGEALTASASPGDMVALGNFVQATGDRVVEAVSYAKSQRNNHLSSEAMGLAMAAALLPTSRSASRWQRVSDTCFDQVGGKLVMADGGTSQYSTNYHRLFVEALVIRELLAGRTASSSSTMPALERAGRYLGALVIDHDGAAGFHGHDDGARILPLAATPHRSLADTVALLSTLSIVPSLVSPQATEAPAWFGRAVADTSADKQQRPSLEHFPDAGIVIARNGTFTVMVRAGQFRFRPAHADMLNIDVWNGATPLTLDRGTASYTGFDGPDDRFQRSDHHSTIVFGAGDHMARAGRFLWADWFGAQVTKARSNADAVVIEVQAQLGPRRVRVRRRIEVTASSVVVDDDVDGPSSTWSTRWQLAAEHTSWLVSQPRDVVTRTERAESYRRLVNDVATVERRPENGRVRSVFRQP